MRRLDQQQGLRRLNAQGIAADAAASALDADLPPLHALQLLETGRGVIIGNLLDCRSDLSALCGAHPGLADDLEALQEEYDRDAQLDSSPMKPVDVAVVGAANLFSGEHDPYRLRLFSGGGAATK